MNFFLIIISSICFCLNLNAPSDLSDARWPLLVADYVGVLFLGRWLISRILPDLSVQERSRILLFFLLLLSIGFIYLRYCWTPFLSINNVNWGFDPQRYYYYAMGLIRGDGELFALNYVGIVYFYQYLMAVFGIDPMVPFFCNVILILFSTLLLYKVYLMEEGKKNMKWVFLLLVPEIVYYSVMSSREVVCMSFCTLVICYLYLYLKTHKISELVKIFLLLLVLALIRPHFAAVMGLIISINLALRSKQKVLLSFISATLVLVILNLVFQVGEEGTISLNEVSFLLESRWDGSNEMNSDFTYNTNSISARLIPHNPVEFVVYGLIRSCLYLIPKSSPLSLFDIDSPYVIGEVVLVYITSFVFLLSIPSLVNAIRNYKTLSFADKLMFQAFWVLFLMVGVLNTTLIQDRYRIVYDFFLLWFLLGRQTKRAGRFNNISPF